VERTPEILKDFGMRQSDLPFLAAAKSAEKCYFFTKKRSSDAERSGFMERFVGQNYSCGEVFGLRARVKRQASATAAPVVVPRNGNGGFFTVVFACSGLFVIGLLRLKPASERKEE
jgi:hypothetical protein